jgi:hypothetical protein
MKKTVLALALAGIGTMAHAVSYNISNDQGGWLASVQAIGPTTFGTGTFTGVGCPPGVACDDVAVNGLPGVSFAQNGPGSASYDGGLLNNLSASGYLEWTFATPQNGWGGTFQMAQNNGLSFQAKDKNLGWIDVTIVGEGQTLDGFLGFSSADQFSGVRVSGLAGNATSYRMTDVSIAAAIPEPETYVLMLAGLAALGFFAGRRKARA